MPSTKRQIDYRPAMSLAAKIRDRLVEACDRIEIAGSVRRQAGRVGDIELVAIPRMEPDGLYGDSSKSALGPLLDWLVNIGKLRPIKGGERFKQYLIETAPVPLALDLFLAEPESWGYQLAIRTGPANYSQWLVTNRHRGGGLLDGFKCKHGQVWRHVSGHNHTIDELTDIDGDWYVPHPVPEETDFFELIHGGWVPPERRK